MAFAPSHAQRIDEAAAAFVSNTDVPGLVLLVARGEEVHLSAHGRQGIGRGPMTPDTLFRIASVTKPLTALTVLSLVGEGRVSLDEPVGRLLPELGGPRVLRAPDAPLSATEPAHRPVAVRNLLDFTFGFGIDGAMFDSPEPWPIVEAANRARLATLGPPEPLTPPDADTWLARLATLPLMRQPGERWLYNTGAQVAGVLAARAGGMRLGEVMAERVLGPLAMRDTGFVARDPERLATAYANGPEGLVEVDREGAWRHRPAFDDGAAGLVSTAEDLFRLARALLAGGSGVTTPALVAQMTSAQLTRDQLPEDALGPGSFVGRSWGLGLAVGEDGSFGWDGGLGTSFLVDPRRDLVIIVLTQRQFDSPALPPVHRAVREAVYAGLAS